MRKHRIILASLVVGLLLLVGSTLAPNAYTKNSHSSSNSNRVTICHIPPGSPQKAQTIVVSQAAVPAHLAHGDTLGACPAAGTTGG
ncbi:hypothetical protein HY229_09520 [Candidatus Acetothermia bacterium]|nr:hypothetical protein [Candidatus Acetothermia bacterium]MBI3644322.1 hypothetical protein [Candidatus Acetothermia bacterium]